jgi:hypothetical protein
MKKLSNLMAIVAVCLLPACMLDHEMESDKSDLGEARLTGELPDEPLQLEEAVLGSVSADTSLQPASIRYCSSNYNCNYSACICSSGICVPNQFGPPPPEDVCSEPPVRSCSSSSDCRTGCACSGGTCEPIGSALDCHLPLIDVYESNDTPANASHYLGTPQYDHNFHRNGDEDWVLVYVGAPMTVTFETFDLSSVVADTFLRVYAYQNGQPGSLLASHDDVCGYYWLASCQASRVVLNAPADTAYFVRITNTASPTYTEYDQSYPTYSLRIY